MAYFVNFQNKKVVLLIFPSVIKSKLLNFLKHAKRALCHLVHLLYLILYHVDKVNWVYQWYTQFTWSSDP